MVNKERMLLGKDAIFSTDTRETGITNNCIVVGSSGSGKTASIIIPKLLETTKSSIVCSVSKRRVVDQFIPVFKQRGYKTVDINFSQPEKSDFCFDPIQYIKSEEDVAYLSNAIIMNNPRKLQSHADIYWDTCSINLLNAIICMTIATKDHATMDDVLANVDRLHVQSGCDHIKTTLDYYFDKFLMNDPTSFTSSNWSVFSKLESTKTAGCVLSSLQTDLAVMFTTGLREQIKRKPCIDIESIGKTKTAMFITTSAMNPALSGFVNVFYGQIFRTLFETAMECKNYRLPIRTSMLYDDFAVSGALKDFPQYTSIIREANMDYTILLQSQSQLAKFYGEYGAKEIINNSDTYVYLGSNDFETSRTISLRADMPVETVLSLPIGKEIIFRRGCNPIFSSRYDTFNDERYVSLFGKENTR